MNKSKKLLICSVLRFNERGLNMNIVKVKKITANENGLMLCDYAGVNSISFLAKLPKSATVDHIKVDGVFLEDLRVCKIINTHKELAENDWRVVATVYFSDEMPTEFYDKIANYVVQDFEVYYHEEAIVEG